GALAAPMEQLLLERRDFHAVEPRLPPGAPNTSTIALAQLSAAIGSSSSKSSRPPESIMSLTGDPSFAGSPTGRRWGVGCPSASPGLPCACPSPSPQFRRSRTVEKPRLAHG